VAGSFFVFRFDTRQFARGSDRTARAHAGANSTGRTWPLFSRPEQNQPPCKRQSLFEIKSASSPRTPVRAGRARIREDLYFAQAVPHPDFQQTRGFELLSQRDADQQPFPAGPFADSIPRTLYGRFDRDRPGASEAAGNQCELPGLSRAAPALPDNPANWTADSFFFPSLKPPTPREVPAVTRTASPVILLIDNRLRRAQSAACLSWVIRSANRRRITLPCHPTVIIEGVGRLNFVLPRPRRSLPCTPRTARPTFIYSHPPQTRRWIPKPPTVPSAGRRYIFWAEVRG